MLGKAIKQYLDERGIKQTFLAEKTNLSVSKINAILNGNRGLLAEEYFMICEVLGVPIETFINQTIKQEAAELVPTG